MPSKTATDYDRPKAVLFTHSFMGPLSERLDVESEDEEEREQAVASAVANLPVSLALLKGGL